MSPQTIHFRVLDKSPVSGPGRGPLSCNNSIIFSILSTNFLSIVFLKLLDHSKVGGDKYCLKNEIKKEKQKGK